MTHPVFGATDPADMILADFGVDLLCAVAPAVTRGILSQTVLEREQNGMRSLQQVKVLKVKRGAFGSARVDGTRVTVTHYSGAQDLYAIDGALPHDESRFDHYALQAVKPRVGGG